MPRCFLIEPVRKDIAKADKFGTVITLFPDNARRPSFWSPDFVTVALDRLDALGYDPSVDLIIAAGNVVPLVLLSAAVARESEGGPRFLFFDAARQDYVVLQLPQLHSTGE